MIERPESTEYASFYASYVDKVEQEDMLQAMIVGFSACLELCSTLSEEQATYRYAPGKWSIKEVIGHLIDSERVFSFRAMSIARGEKGSLPGFDENSYVEEAYFDKRTFGSLIEEYTLLRKANIVLFSSWDSKIQKRIGTANQIGLSVRALVAIIAGHEQHHLQVIRERYLTAK